MSVENGRKSRSWRGGKKLFMGWIGGAWKADESLATVAGRRVVGVMLRETSIKRACRVDESSHRARGGFGLRWRRQGVRGVLLGALSET